ncbi:MAG TPA: plasmid stabilization protein [Pseudonocardiaceae bacterium]|nr:plasmid stabilization protein [Pseudonocardiaceae bacterium]
MATLTIRDLDDDVKAALRVRAAGHGRSMGSEVREILRHTLTNQETGGGLGSRIAARFADLDAPATLLDRWSAWRPAR